MCVRYDLDHEHLIVWSHLVKAWITVEDWTAGLDTFPGYQAPILVPDWSERREKRVVFRAQWGLIPPWADNPNFGKKNAFNARSETIAEKPAFRSAFKSRRCVAPADAFYERLNGRWLRFAGREVLAMAGVYENANRLCPVPSYAVVTTEPNDRVAVAQDRMPVLLDSEGVDRWLDPNTTLADLVDLMVPTPDDWLSVADAGPIRPPRQPAKGLFEE